MDPLISQSVSGENKEEDESKGYFILRAKINEDDYEPAAKLFRLAVPYQGRAFGITRLTENDKVFNTALSNLEYYLVQLPNENRQQQAEQIWDYQIYHCSTAANIYSEINWSYHEAQKSAHSESNKLNEAEQSSNVHGESGEEQASDYLSSSENQKPQMTSLYNSSKKILLLYRFRVELIIATSLIITQLLYRKIHWTVDFILFLLLAVTTRMAYRKTQKIMTLKRNLFKKTFWLLMTAIIGVSAFVAILSIVLS